MLQSVQPGLRAAVLASWLAGLAGLVESVRLAFLRWQLADFRLYYGAARVGEQHGWSRIYDLQLQAAAVSAISSGQWFPYLNPPPLAWLITPLTRLGYPAAFWAWYAIGLLAIALAATLLAPPGAWRAATALGLLLALFPVEWALAAGQVVPLVLLATVAGWRLLAADRPYLAGLVLTACFLKPQLVVLLPLALLAAGRWRTLAVWMLAGCLLAGISFLSLGEAGTAQYLGDLRTAGAYPAQLRWSLDGFVGPSVAWLLRAAVAALVAWIAYRGRREGIEAALAAAIAGSLLVATYLNAQDFAMLGAAAGIWLRDAPRAGRSLLVALGFVAVELAQAVELPVLLAQAALLVALALPRAPRVVEATA